MIDIPRRYQAAFFADISDISPTPDTIKGVLDLLGSEGFLPTTFAELGPQGPRVRLRFSEQENGWVIDFDSNRITIAKGVTKPKGANMGPVDVFVKDVVHFGRRILTLFPKKGHRLSLVTDGLLPEMPENKLQAIYESLFRPIAFYAEHRPVEWRSRSAARVVREVCDTEETLNVITKVSRIQGELAELDGATPLDRIAVVFDINTYQRNTETRFDAASMEDYYPKALEVREALIAELEGVIDAH